MAHIQLEPPSYGGQNALGSKSKTPSSGSTVLEKIVQISKWPQAKRINTKIVKSGREIFFTNLFERAGEVAKKGDRKPKVSAFFTKKGEKVNFFFFCVCYVDFCYMEP